MNFECSTQARSWIFDEYSLHDCREKVVEERASAILADRGLPKVRKFASGFRNRLDAACVTDTRTVNPRPQSKEFSQLDLLSNHSFLTPKEEAILVRFHAHQITTLIGPAAILPSLVRGPTVLATAIAFFRRFYLSNSVLDFNPRRMAVAAAFLAAKVEDQKVEIDSLEHATDLIQREMHCLPYCQDELSYVTVEEIEIAERDLMAGINYEMRCHHPYNAIRILAAEVEKFLLRDEDPRFFNFENMFDRRNDANTVSSPRDVRLTKEHEFSEGIEERAFMVARNSMISSDVLFLYPPGQIAFAAIAMSIRDGHQSLGLPLILRTYLRDRFISKTENELLSFEKQVSDIVQILHQCPEMEMQSISMTRNNVECDLIVVERSDELLRVLRKVSNFQSSAHPAKPTLSVLNQKRKYADMTPLSDRLLCVKIPKVTPTKV